MRLIWPNLAAACLKLVLLFLTGALAASADTYKSIRDVDFKNFTYPWDTPSSSPGSGWTGVPEQQKVRLRNGMHRFIDPHADPVVREHSPYLSYHFATYGDLDGDGVEEAAVAVNYHTGGTDNWDYLYVYKLERGRLKLLDRLESGNRAYRGLIRGVIQDGILTLDFADPEKRTGDCCTEGYIRMHYRWDGHRFVQQGTAERADLKQTEEK